MLPEQATAAHQRLAVACGKQGVIDVLDRAGNVGKYNGPGGPDLVVQSIALYPDRVRVGPGRPSGSDASTPGVYGAPGYYSGPDGPRLFYCGSNGPVKAFTLENGVLSPQTLQTGGPLNQSSESYLGQVDESGTPSAAGGCTPVVSSNADAPGTAVV